MREAARKTRDNARKANQLDAAPLVGKLSACRGKKAEDNELFIVEGDSAGGSAKMGRDRHFQAILPLRGKPLNVEKKRLDQVLANEEFRSLITALGTGIGEDFDIKSLKYYKVIILSDADQDGAHIRAILLTFFYRFMPQLIEDGYVYGVIVEEHDNEIGFILLDEDGNEQEYYYVAEDNDGDGVRVERTSDGDEFDLGISREGVAAATRDVNAIYKDGVQVAAELKSTFDEISDSLSFLKKKK